MSVSIENELKKISNGANCREGKTWSPELADKIYPVQYSMRNCDGDENKFRQNMDSKTLS